MTDNILVLKNTKPFDFIYRYCRNTPFKIQPFDNKEDFDKCNECGFVTLDSFRKDQLYINSNYYFYILPVNTAIENSKLTDYVFFPGIIASSPWVGAYHAKNVGIHKGFVDDKHLWVRFSTLKNLNEKSIFGLLSSELDFGRSFLTMN